MKFPHSLSYRRLHLNWDFFLALRFCPNPLAYHPLHSHYALGKLFIPVSPFTHCYPALQLGFSFWRYTNSREEMTQGDLGTDIKFHCLDTLPLRCSCICIWKEACTHQGLTKAGRGFPRAVGAVQQRAGTWWGIVRLGIGAAMPAVGSAQGSRGQSCQVSPSLLAHSSHCCAEDVWAAACCLWGSMEAEGGLTSAATLKNFSSNGRALQMEKQVCCIPAWLSLPG